MPLRLFSALQRPSGGTVKSRCREIQYLTAFLGTTEFLEEELEPCRLESVPAHVPQDLRHCVLGTFGRHCSPNMVDYQNYKLIINIYIFKKNNFLLLLNF